MPTMRLLGELVALIWKELSRPWDFTEAGLSPGRLSEECTRILYRGDGLGQADCPADC
jgi:hypothetical protein